MRPPPLPLGGRVGLYDLSAKLAGLAGSLRDLELLQHTCRSEELEVIAQVGPCGWCCVCGGVLGQAGRERGRTSAAATCHPPQPLRLLQQLTVHLPIVSCPSQLTGLTSLALTSRHCRVMATPVPEVLSQLTALGQLKICHGLTQVRNVALPGLPLGQTLLPLTQLPCPMCGIRWVPKQAGPSCPCCSRCSCFPHTASATHPAPAAALPRCRRCPTP